MLENNKTILKSQLKFRSDAHNAFTEKVNKIGFSLNDFKRAQVPERVISYPHGVGLGIFCKQELTRHPKIKNDYNDWLWPQIPDHLYVILIVGGSGSGKMNALLGQILHKPDIDKIFLCVKDPCVKIWVSDKNSEEAGLKHFKEPKAFIEY